MVVKIHYTICGMDDSFNIIGVDENECRKKGRAEIKKRYLERDRNKLWSEIIER